MEVVRTIGGILPAVEHTTKIVGILNITPDSYFDGGKYLSVAQAVRQAARLFKEGADIVDIGGESTFVDREDVSKEEELQRVIPVIQAIKERFPTAILSIDTTKSAVARRAVAAGASSINDVTAGRGDPEMFTFAAEAGVPIILMYSKDESSRTTTDAVQYDDVMKTIINFLQGRIELALAAGVQKSQIILDPGLGFFVSGDARYSYEILAHLPRLKEIGYPVFVSPSRKSFLAGPKNLAPMHRLPGTIAASAIAVLHGANYIRTHDVQAVRRGCDTADAILGSLE